MTITTMAHRGAEVTEYADALGRELAEASREAGQARDVPARLAALDRLTDLLGQLENTRRDASATAKAAIEDALRAGVDPRDLYGRPFSSTVVRSIAASLGIRYSSGPRPRTTPKDDRTP